MVTLKHANPKQAKEIYSRFLKHKTWFPHIRMDYVERMVNKGNVIYQDGIIIIYKQYQRRTKIGTGRTIAEAGDVMLHQILNVNEGSGNATKTLMAFFEMINAPVWLTVRKENSRAAKFYLRNGMKKVGTTSWMNGTLPGLVFRYNP